MKPCGITQHELAVLSSLVPPDSEDYKGFSTTEMCGYSGVSVFFYIHYDVEIKVE